MTIGLIQVLLDQGHLKLKFYICNKMNSSSTRKHNRTIKRIVLSVKNVLTVLNDH